MNRETTSVSPAEEAGVAKLWDQFKRGEVSFIQIERTKSGRVVTKHAAKVHAGMYAPDSCSDEESK